jgi:hypothetical protein
LRQEGRRAPRENVGKEKKEERARKKRAQESG